MPDRLTVSIDFHGLLATINQYLAFTLKPSPDQKAIEISAAYMTRKGRSSAIVIEPQSQMEKGRLDLPPNDLKKLVRGMVWREAHFNGTSLQHIAQENNCSWTYVSNCIDYSFRSNLITPEHSLFPRTNSLIPDFEFPVILLPAT